MSSKEVRTRGRFTRIPSVLVQVGGLAAFILAAWFATDAILRAAMPLVFAGFENNRIMPSEFIFPLALLPAAGVYAYAGWVMFRGRTLAPRAAAGVLGAAALSLMGLAAALLFPHSVARYIEPTSAFVMGALMVMVGIAGGVMLLRPSAQH